MKYYLRIILIILGGFLSGLLGSYLFATINSNLGFVIGIMIFAVMFCTATVGDPPDK